MHNSFLIVIRFMEESRRGSQVQGLFKAFKESRYCFDAKDAEKIESVFKELGERSEQSVIVVAALSAGSDVSKLFVARAQLQHEEENNKWKACLVGEPRTYCKGEYFDGLVSLLSFSPCKPKEDGFATVIRSKWLTQVFSLALPGSNNALVTAPLYERQDDLKEERPILQFDATA